jgi:hypothetical protein
LWIIKYISHWPGNKFSYLTENFLECYNESCPARIIYSFFLGTIKFSLKETALSGSLLIITISEFEADSEFSSGFRNFKWKKNKR